MTRIYLASVVLLYAILFWLAFAHYAAAAPQCAPRADVVAGLACNYGETPVAMGIASNGHMVEVFASPKGTWTFVGTDPLTGITCLMASGDAFHAIPQGVMG